MLIESDLSIFRAQVIVFGMVVYFFANIFFTFIYLQQPSFAFIGEGYERGVGGDFGRPPRCGVRRLEPGNSLA
jgi:hypothetical protein